MSEPLQHYQLADHGDRHERRLWPLVSQQFPSYEIFWRDFIVPLSYRADETVSVQSPEWLRLMRSISPSQELLAMTHYSVFYWISRAKERCISEGKIDFPEDTLFLLDSSLDCLDLFFKQIRKFGTDSGITFRSIPNKQVSRSAAVFVEIKAYRNTILHNPVLGRGVDVDATYIVRQEHLPTVKSSWAAAEQLARHSYEKTPELLNRLTNQMLTELERIWTLLLADIAAHPALGRKLRTVEKSASPTRSAEAASIVGHASSPGVSGGFSIDS
jgi:hypothetical protein